MSTSIMEALEGAMSAVVEPKTKTRTNKKPGTCRISETSFDVKYTSKYMSAHARLEQ
jgi:hypothetical protein